MKSCFAVQKSFHAIVLGSSLVASVALPQTAQAIPIDFLASGAAPADIQSTVTAFRSALGNLNPNQPVSFASGRREINWDGVPDGVSDPVSFPGNFFNGSAAPRARGIEFTATGATTGFEVSSSVNPVFGESGNFQTFSPAKLFRTVGGDEFDIRFFLPTDQTTGATTTGFGMVFTDADSDQPVLDFYDANNHLIHSLTGSFTPSAGLGFMGTTFDAATVARIHVRAGDRDGLVMDDFIFGESRKLPEPGTLPLMLAGILCGLGYAGRKYTRNL